MELTAYKAMMRIFKHYLIGRDKDRTNIKRCKEMFGARSIQHIVHIEKSHTFSKPQYIYVYENCKQFV